MNPIEFLNLFGEFCKNMQVDLPTTRIDQYTEALFNFSENILKDVFKEWAMNHPPKFMPSPNDLVSLSIEINKRNELKGGPRYVTDLYGKRVRADTELARELRQIMKALIGTPTFKYGRVQLCGVVTYQEAIEMIEDAEILYGPAHEPSTPKRKSDSECMADACVDEALAIRAVRKSTHKRNEYERDELRKIARTLIPYGYFIMTATEDGLKIGKMDDEVWSESFGLLNDYAEKI